MTDPIKAAIAAAYADAARIAEDHLDAWASDLDATRHSLIDAQNTGACNGRPVRGKDWLKSEARRLGERAEAVAESVSHTKAAILARAAAVAADPALIGVDDQIAALQAERDEALAQVERMRDVRSWWHYSIEMPLSSDGQGPAMIGVDAKSMTYEVWDQTLNTHSSHDNLPDAINAAMQMNSALTPEETKT